MKKLFSLFSILTVALLFTSCLKDVVSTKDMDNGVEFSIEYNTNEAQWDATNPETLRLNKLGVGTTGTVPYLIVKSNRYWTVSVPEEYASFLTVSPNGGPEPNTTFTNVYIHLTENSGENRDAEVWFALAGGITYRVPIYQLGPLSSSSEARLTFLADDFGAGARFKEDQLLKFYSFDGTNGGKSYTGLATAGDTYAFQYSGTDNVYASHDEPSQGYEDLAINVDGEGKKASGGVNVLLNGEGYITLKNFNNQNKTDFRISFGAKNSDGKFREKDLILRVSPDNIRWSDPMPYIHTVNKVNDWSLNYLDFTIAPDVSKILFFKFENTSEDAYRLDDLNVVEWDPSDNFYPLIDPGSDIIGLPVSFKFNNLDAGYDDTKDGGKGSAWHRFGLQLSEESGAYDKNNDERPAVTELIGTSASMQFICGSDASLVKNRNDGLGMIVTSSSPKVTSGIEGDYWLFTIPVHNAAANTNLGVNLSFMSTDAGPKYYDFSYAQCLAQDYTLPASLHALTDAEKRAFYDTLEWTVYNPKSKIVPDDVDKCDSKYKGIPVGSASSPQGYYNGVVNYSGGPEGASWDFFIKSASVNTKTGDDFFVTFPDAMEDGYYFIRLRISSNLTAGSCNSTQFQRMNKVDHNGTNYLKEVAQFTFKGCGAAAAYKDAFRVYTTFSNVNQYIGYTGQNPEFTSEAQVGVFAGDTPNILVSDASNNTLSGRCAANESGHKTYLYTPYSAMNSDASDVEIAVPATQKIAANTLVADSAPFVLGLPLTFKSTSAMRATLELVSPLVALNIYSKEAVSDRISKIVLEGNGIAGTRSYDLVENVMGNIKSTSNIVTATALESISIPTSKNSLKLYSAVWEGTHTLKVKIYAGPYIYSTTLAEAEFKAPNKSTGDGVTEFDIDMATCDKVVNEDVDITGITDAAKLRQFLLDYQAGKTGVDMDTYRTIDGEYGFAAKAGDEKVIDMAGVDMSTWPQVTLNDNFNGGGFTIKNMVVSTPDVALFKNITYGNTISNIILDSSCKLDADISLGANWSLLLSHGNVDATYAERHIATGNIENIVTYAEVDVYGAATYTTYIAPIIAYASGARVDSDTPSQIRNCQNRGRLYLHDIVQDVPYSTQAYYYYLVVAGIIGEALGIEVTNCQNYGDLVAENCDRKYGTLFFAGIVGYSCNYLDKNTVSTFGNVNHCDNYGNVSFGQDGRICRWHVVGVGGVGARTQWSNMSNLTNYGTFNIKATVYDPYSNGYSMDWPSKIKATTNALGFFSVGGIYTFAQCNINIGVQNTLLTNNGDINVDVDMDGTIDVADNVGISVGGVMGLMGANAYNPHFNNCVNSANITVHSNAASADVYLGGIMGRMASNRYTADSNYSINGSANTGEVKFITDNPETVRAQVGGICGSAIYGEMKSNTNAGAVSSQSTAEGSHVASILGVVRKSSIGTGCSLTPVFKLHSTSVGGSINGTPLSPENFADYILGGIDDTVDKSYVIDVPTTGPNASSFFSW